MKRRNVFLGALAVVLAAGGAFAYKMFGPPPTGTDFARTRTAAKGLYVVAIAPEKEPLARASLHSWIATIKTASGAEVVGATLLIDGGMPKHGHGLPTEPKMSAELGKGRYRIDGVKFNMFGWWKFKIAIKAPQGDDAVTFNLNL